MSDIPILKDIINMYSIPNYTKDWLSIVNGLNMFFGFVWVFIFSCVFLYIVFDGYNDWNSMRWAGGFVFLLYLLIAAGSISISVFGHPEVRGCGLESEPPSTSFACNYEGGGCSNAPGSPPSLQCKEVHPEVYYNIESFKRYIVDEKVDDDEPSGSKYKFSWKKALYTEGIMLIYIFIILSICVVGKEVIVTGATTPRHIILLCAIYVIGIGGSIGLGYANRYFLPLNPSVTNPLPQASLMCISLIFGFIITKPWSIEQYKPENSKWMALFPIVFVIIIPFIQDYSDSNDYCINKTKPLCLKTEDKYCAWDGDKNECRDYHTVFQPDDTPPDGGGDDTTPDGGGDDTPPDGGGDDTPPPPPPAPCSSYTDESGCNSGNNCYYVKANIDRSEFSPEGITKVDSKTGCISKDNKCADYSCNSEFYPLNIFDVCCEKQLTTNGCDIGERNSHLDDEKEILDETKQDDSSIKTLYGQEAWSKKIDYDESYRYCESKNRRSEMEAGIYA